MVLGLVEICRIESSHRASLALGQARRLCYRLWYSIASRGRFLGGLSLLAVGIIASYLIPGVLRQHGYVPAPHSSSVWKYLAVPFQTLNEEMVLRAMLLTALAHIVKVRLATSISVAAVFMVLHFVLYLLGPPHVALSIQSLTTLFLVGLAFNEFSWQRAASPFPMESIWDGISPDLATTGLIKARQALFERGWIST